MPDDKPMSDPEKQEMRDELSAKLDHGAAIVGDLLKVCRVYGERGAGAVYAHTAQLSEDELRTTLSALVTYTSIANQQVAAMFVTHNGGLVDGPTLN